MVDWGPVIRPTRAEIDLVSVVENSRCVGSWANSAIIAVVKADAYGHGACQVALALQSADTVSGFAVSLVEEGIELRRAGIFMPILVMGAALHGAYHELVEYKLVPFVSEIGHLQPLAAAAKAEAQQIGIHLKVNTGMNRLGVAPAELYDFVRQVDLLAELRLEGIGSHLASADVDDPDDSESMTNQQLRRFDVLVNKVSGRAVRFHVANSDGIARFPNARYDIARPGISLYGNGGSAAKLTQAMSLVSKISHLRQLSIGERVSYGGCWTSRRPSILGVVPVGYADGLPRSLSGKGSVLISGVRCPIVGAISMDMTVVDVTDLSRVSVGDEVVLLGRQGVAQILASEIALYCGISEYEVTCGISKRVPRVFRGEYV